MSHDMTKPTMWLCAQRRLRLAWASAQSDQSLRCPHEALGPYLPIERTAKTLIRLGGCLGWSESWLGAHTCCWFCHVAALIINECSNKLISIEQNTMYYIKKTFLRTHKTFKIALYDLYEHYSTEMDAKSAMWSSSFLDDAIKITKRKLGEGNEKIFFG